MAMRMTQSSVLLLLVVSWLALLQPATAFCPASLTQRHQTRLYAETDEKTGESAFVPLEEQDDDDDDDILQKAELLGRGAAKVRSRSLVAFFVLMFCVL